MPSAKIDIISGEPLSFQSEDTITLYLEITLKNTCGQLVIFVFIYFIFEFIHFPLNMFINFIFLLSLKNGKFLLSNILKLKYVINLKIACIFVP